MKGIRRWYIYLVSFISLQALAWAIISLLQNLLIYGRLAGAAFETDSLSWQIAIIIVTLPLFLVHWLWAQRLALQDSEEHTSWVRGFYLYGVMVSFLIPIVFNGYELLQYLFQLLIKTEPRFTNSRLTPTQAALTQLLPIVVLAVLWFYHYRLVGTDSQAAGPLKTARRWYMFGFSAAGLTMTAVGTITLLRWILLPVGDDAAIVNSYFRLSAELARLAVGIPLWLLFWRQAQHRFAQADQGEQQSTLRKFYLYAIIFVTALTAVGAATGILAGILRELFGLSPQGDIRDPIAIIVIMGTLWFYHARVLQQDIQASDEQPKQATIRRLYWYLIAAIGLAAFLLGLGGDISVLIRSFSTAFITELREQLAWFTAALVAGLPVWLWPWRQAQAAAAEPGDAGSNEREAIVRKIYLYFYIFVATMTVLASAVYLVYRLVSLILGASTSLNLGAELAQAIAYALIAIAVWLYHGATLRSDTRLADVPVLPESLRVAVVAGPDGRLAPHLLTALQQALPFATVQAVGVPAEVENGHAPETVLAEAELIISPWPMGKREEVLATAVTHSPARKLLIPIRQAGWEWVGVEPWNLDEIISETVEASRQMAIGGAVTRSRSRSISTVLSIIGGVLGLLIIMSILLSFFLEYLF
ncbi:MAG: hypothetical protein KC449_08815 [Anaerolineales bacterium]|nr:hypothetical protein [Anaerolineales bacterium]